MEDWKYTALILCAFGFFKEFRPSENYLTDYLVDFKDIPLESLVHIAFPVATYSYLATLFLVFLLTDFLRYRTVIVIEAVAYVCTYVLLIWGNTLTMFIVVEIVFGVSMSTEIAYYTYIYAKVDKEHYKKVTSYTYTAIFTGRFFSAISGQILVSFRLMDYHALNYLTLSAEIIAFIIVLFLPKVQESIYFHRNDNPGGRLTPISSSTSIATSMEEPSFGTFDRTTSCSSSPPSIPLPLKIRRACPILWLHFKTAYTNSYVLQWSIWWAFAMAGHLQVINYIQALWSVIAAEGGGTANYNAAADAVLCTLSGLGAMAVGHITISWKRWSETSITIISILMAIFLVFISQTKHMYFSYAGYILFRVIFQVNLTIASAEISQQILEDSHGLVFGLNTFMALVLQTILTIVTTDQNGFALSERSQFLVIGIAYGILALGFLVFASYKLISWVLRGIIT